MRICGRVKLTAAEICRRHLRSERTLILLCMSAGSEHVATAKVAVLPNA